MSADEKGVATTCWPPRLPPRQAAVLQRLCEGDAEKQVARTLGVSRSTVHVYVKAIYRVYGVHSRAELLAAVFRMVSLTVARSTRVSEAAANEASTSAPDLALDCMTGC